MAAALAACQNAFGLCCDGGWRRGVTVGGEVEVGREVPPPPGNTIWGPLNVTFMLSGRASDLIDHISSDVLGYSKPENDTI